MCNCYLRLKPTIETKIYMQKKLNRKTNGFHLIFPSVVSCRCQNCYWNSNSATLSEHCFQIASTRTAHLSRRSRMLASSALAGKPSEIVYAPQWRTLHIPQWAFGNRINQCASSSEIWKLINCDARTCIKALIHLFVPCVCPFFSSAACFTVPRIRWVSARPGRITKYEPKKSRETAHCLHKKNKRQTIHSRQPHVRHQWIAYAIVHLWYRFTVAAVRTLSDLIDKIDKWWRELH